jgi:hypothetical protein
LEADAKQIETSCEWSLIKGFWIAGEEAPFARVVEFGQWKGEGDGFADIQSAGEKRTDGATVQDSVAGAAGIAAAARSLHACVHADAEEAEFRVAEGSSRAPDEWD